MNYLPILGFGLLALAVLAVGALCFQLLRQNGRILLRLDLLEKRLAGPDSAVPAPPKVTGLAEGTEAPAFDLPDLGGTSRSLAGFRGKPLLLIFFNPDCGFCRLIGPRLAALSGEGLPLTVIIAQGNAEKIRAYFTEHKITSPVLLQGSTDLGRAYQVHGTPMGCIIDAQGKIASPLIVGSEPLLDVAETKLDTTPGNRPLSRSLIQRDGLKAGTPAPDFTLPRLDGSGDISLAALRGKPVLLVFSDPKCGPCQAMTPQLETFHRQHPETQVLMVSRGEPADNLAKVKEMDLTFPIALQKQWEISKLYAMFATPIAYLIDKEGVIQHDIAVGPAPIIELMGNGAKVVPELAAALV